MNSLTMKDLKKSKVEYFKLSADSSVVYMVNHYDRGSKTYSISPVEDWNRETFVKPSREVYIGFTY